MRVLLNNSFDLSRNELLKKIWRYKIHVCVIQNYLLTETGISSWKCKHQICRQWKYLLFSRVENIHAWTRIVCFHATEKTIIQWNFYHSALMKNYMVYKAKINWKLRHLIKLRDIGAFLKIFQQKWINCHTPA